MQQSSHSKLKSTWVRLICIGIAGILPSVQVRAEDSHTIENVGTLSWQTSGQTTFAGALELVLAKSPHPASYATLMGASGLAFRLRWHTPAPGKPFAGVGPIGELPDDIGEISRIFGLKVQDGMARPDDAAGRERIRKQITSSVAADRPVICYVSPHQDCGVVYGFKDDGKTVLVRDYYPESAGEQPFTKLDDIFLFVEPGGAPLSPREALLSGLKTAVKNFKRTDQPEFGGGHFLYGSAAYSGWRDALTRVGDGEKGAHLARQINWWVMNSLIDARSAASTYLLKSVSLLRPDAQAHLQRAAEIYKQAAALGREAMRSNETFAPPWSGKSDADWSLDVRNREIETLKRCEQMDAEAIGEIEKALAA